MATAAEVRAGGAFVAFYAKGEAAVNKTIANLQARMQNFAKGVAFTGAAIAGAGAAIVAPFLQGLAVFTEWGDEMRSTIRQTGIGFEQLDHIMDGVRVSGEELVPAVAKMSEFVVAAASGNGPALQALQQMGISIEELTAASQGDRLLMLADGLERIADESQRIALQRDVFGRNGLNLQLQGGRAGIAQRAARTDYLEGSPTPADLQLAKETSAAQKEMGVALKGLWREIGAAAAPVMRDFFKLMTEGIVSVREFVAENRTLFTVIFRVADLMVTAGTAIGILGGVIYGASYAFAFLSGAIAITKGFLLGLWAVTVFVATGMGIGKVLTLAWTAAWWLYNAATTVAHVLTWAWVPLLAAVGIAFSIIPMAIGAVIIGLAALGYYLIWSSGIIQKVWGVLMEWAEKAYSVVEPIIGKLIEIWSAFNDVLISAWGFVLAPVARVFSGIFDIASGAVRAIVGIFSGVGTILSNAFSQTTAIFSEMFSAIVDDASLAWGGIMDAFAIGDWSMLWEIVKTTALLAWNRITFAVVGIWNTWKDAAHDTFAAIWTNIRVMFAEGWAFVKTGWFTALASILDAWVGVQVAMENAADAALHPFRSAADQAVIDRNRLFDARSGVRALEGQATDAARDLHPDQVRFAGMSNADVIREEAAGDAAHERFLRRRRDEARNSGNAGELAFLEAELATLTLIAEMNRENQVQRGSDAIAGGGGMMLAARAMTQGTFSADALRGFAGGGNPLERLGMEQRDRLDRIIILLAQQAAGFAMG